VTKEKREREREREKIEGMQIGIEW